MSKQFIQQQLFPKAHFLPSLNRVSYVAHYGPIVKVISVKSNNFPNHVVSISNDRKIILWNVLTNKCEKSFMCDFIMYDIIYIDEDFVISVGECIQKLNLTNLDIPFLIKSKIGHFREYGAIAKVNNQNFAVASLKLLLHVYETDTGKLLKTIDFYKVHYVCHVESLPETKELEAKIMKRAKEEEEEEKEIERERIELEKEKAKEKEKENESLNNKRASLAGSPEGTGKFAASTEMTSLKQKVPELKPRLTDIRPIGSAKCLETKDRHRDVVFIMKQIEKNDHFRDCVVSGGWDNVVKITRIENSEIIDFNGHTDNITAIATMGNFLLSGSYDRTIMKWNMLSRQCEEVITDFTACISIIQPLNDGKRFLASSIDKRVKVYNEDCKSEKTYYYKNGILKTVASIGEDAFVFGDNKGEIFVKHYVENEEEEQKVKKEISKQNTIEEESNQSYMSGEISKWATQEKKTLSPHKARGTEESKTDPSEEIIEEENGEVEEEN